MSVTLKLKRNGEAAENKSAATAALSAVLSAATEGEPSIATYADGGDALGILFGISAGDGQYAIFDNHFKTVEGQTVVGDGNIDLSSKYATNTELDAISGTVSSNYNTLNGRINTVSGSVTSLTQTVTSNYNDLDGRIDTVSGRVNTISGTVSSNYTDLNGKITTVSGRVNTISGAVDNINGSLGTYATKTELKNYLPLSGGTLTGRLNANQGVAMSGKTASDLLNGAGSTTAVSSIVSSAATTVRGSAPAGLDTLGEIAASIGNSTNFSGAMDTKLAAKVDKADQLATVVTGVNTAATYSANSVSIRHTRKQLDGGTHEYGNDATLSTVISAATTTAAGVMSAADKSKLNALPSASNVVTLDGTQTISGTKTFSQRVTAAGFKIPSGTADGILTADGGVKSLSGLSSEITALIVSGAPEALDTLNELAAALDDDPDFASTVMNEIGTKADIGHKHEIGDVNGLQNALNGKANASHTHAISGVTGLQTALDAKVDADDLAEVATTGSYNDLLNKPTIPVVDSALSSGSTNAIQNKAVYAALQGKSNTGHTHKASEISGLAKVATSGSYNDLSNKPSIPVVDATLSSGSTNAIQNKAVYNALQGKANTGHKHAISDVDGLQDALDNKANIQHTHVLSAITDLHDTWESALKTEKPNYITSVNLASISDLNANWDAFLKADPVLVNNAVALTNQDLNSLSGISQCGYYYAGGANSVKNKPSNVDAFAMVILRGGSGVVSQVLIHGQQNNMYTRYYISNSWSGWVRFAKTSDLTWSSISGKPSTFTPSAHNHAISDVTDLQSTLNGKSNTNHIHPDLIITFNGGVDLDEDKFVYDGRKPVSIDITPELLDVSKVGHEHLIDDVTDINSGWTGLLQAEPSAFVTRWPDVGDIRNLHNSWDAVLTAQKPNWSVSGHSHPTLTIQGNGSTIGTYSATSAVTINITPSKIGAATSSHTHTEYLTQASADTRYVNASGDTINGDLKVQDLVVNTIKAASGASATTFFATDGTKQEIVALTEKEVTALLV